MDHQQLQGNTTLDTGVAVMRLQVRVSNAATLVTLAAVSSRFAALTDTTETRHMPAYLQSPALCAQLNALHDQEGSSPPGGTFTLGLRGAWTPELPWDISGADLAAALQQALPLPGGVVQADRQDALRGINFTLTFTR